METQQNGKKKLALPTFVLRNSLFDEQYEDFALGKSPFVGLYHLFIVFQFVYLFSMYIVRFVFHGFHFSCDTARINYTMMQSL